MDLWEARMRMDDERTKELGYGTRLVQKYSSCGPWVYEYDDE